jgi:hypothetical protein
MRRENLRQSRQRFLDYRLFALLDFLSQCGRAGISPLSLATVPKWVGRTRLGVQPIARNLPTCPKHELTVLGLQDTFGFMLTAGRQKLGKLLTGLQKATPGALTALEKV